MSRTIIYAVSALVVAGLMWWLVAMPRIELAESNHATAAEKIVELQKLDEQRVDLIRDQQLQILDITENERRNRELLQTIAGQSRAQFHALKELQQNDKTITEYLRDGVPVELGRLYQRTATTDPGTYRKPSEVRTD
ncbi:hypothetical protein [Denitrificimonas caeni]|uniref:hypothetical protein n=1 Tax=Denitrificimonas caeni TaxID=521720 RepID=UPI001965FCE2|nr:hypothetical protein [Denitrificimonas caeni]